MSINTFESTLEALNEKLAKNNLGYIYDVVNETENGLILPFFAATMDYCKLYGLEFAISTDREARAGIDHSGKFIFLSYGAFDRICKLAELIVVSGVLDGHKIDFRFSSLHLIDNPFVGLNNSDTFLEGNGKTDLFLFVFDILLDFIVHHELGHHYHQHGDRFEQILDDVIGHRRTEEEEIISSHTRELVADGYAFSFVTQKVEAILEKSGNGRLDCLKKYDSESGRAFIAILIITCYFKMMDDSNVDHFNSSHPLHSFRAKFILASHIERSTDDTQTISDVIANVRRVFDILSEGENTDLDWIGRINTEEMNQWHRAIFEEFPKWLKSS